MAATMKIRMLYFAVVRERLRRGEEVVELPEGATVGALLDELERRHEGFGAIRRACKVAQNREAVTPDARLADGDEVALIPPVSGGAAGAQAPLAAVRDTPLDLMEVVRAVSHPGSGGVVTFTGLVRRESHGRQVTRLEYEAYQTMAEERLAAIAAEIEAGTPGARVAILHRVGALGVGEVAVVIAASAPHRAEAFAAAREAIERLKVEVPIWKKEIGADGEEWIGFGP